MQPFYMMVSSNKHSLLQPHFMKKIFTTLAILLFAYASRACYADYTYNNACVGDTVFFHALDGFAAYSWDYGDSTSGVANVSHDVNGYHVYTAPGDYYVTLFVNIGAEWDYRTNVIHIGSTCFDAGFETQCSSLLYVSFADRSYGTHSSQVWDFGDAASGVLNTDTNVAPTHQFTAEGNYVITYIISDGVQSDTLTGSINVDSTCTTAYVPNFTAAMNCVNDTVKIYASYSAGVTNVFWDFNDPASGIGNYSTALQPSHVYSAPGNYLVTLIYTDGITTDTVKKMLPVMDCSVWPGDANCDGEVNGEDIFPLGIYFSQHGPRRNAASSNWSAQACNSWNSNGWSYMYLQDLVDMKMADCNGDSTINALDVNTIQTNYGRKHTSRNNRSTMLIHSANDPTLAVQLANGTVNAGSDIVATISLGTSAVPSGMVYGGSFTLLFDASKVDANATVSFSLGWLDSTGNSMITFMHETYSDGKLEIAFVKTNNQSQAGYGPIATVTFHTKSTASGTFDLQIDGTAKLFNTNQFSGSGGNQEVFRDMYLQGATATINNATGIAAVTKSAVSIYPNPSNGWIFIQHEKMNEPLQLEMFNTLGEKVFGKALNSANETETVLLPEMANGLYQVCVKKISGEMVQNQNVLLQK